MTKSASTVWTVMLCLMLAHTLQPAIAGEAKPAGSDTDLVDQLAQADVVDLGGSEVQADDAVTPADSGEPETAEDIACSEEVRRQAAEIEGRLALKDADRAFDIEKFDVALGKYNHALLKYPERASNEAERDHARKRIAECEYQIALRHVDEKELDEADVAIDKALEKDELHEGAKRLKSKIERIREKEDKVAARPARIKDRGDIVKATATIEDLTEKGKQLVDVGRYEEAKENFQRVLLVDPYNRRAMEFLRHINEKIFLSHTRHYDATVQGMLGDVRAAWTPPISLELIEVEDDLAQLQGKTGILREKEEMRKKMAAINIPHIEFREANINDVVAFLVEASISCDPEENPDKKGINIILNLNTPGQAAAPAAGAAPAGWPDAGGFDAAPEAAPSTGGGWFDVPTVTLSLRRISLLDAIRYITEVTSLKYRIERNVVMIVRGDVVSGRVITRMYPVQPTFADLLRKEAEDTGGAADDPFAADIRRMPEGKKYQLDNARDFFHKMGVPFPGGTSVTYNQGISKLIVVNTPENLEIFESVLAQLNVIPTQVEIEARFVEVSQSELEELGLEWMLTDNWEIAMKNAPPGTPLGARERVQMDRNSNDKGFTRGLRFWDTDSTGSEIRGAAGGAIGKVLSISSVLTNPELKMVLHALDRSGKANLLSAPKVTTRSAQNATIKVVTEYIYPTEYETDNIGGSFGAAGLRIGDGAQIDIDALETWLALQPEPIIAIPAAFETRETGVILNVTPTVGPDGYTIDLVMQPEVAELTGWISYGTVAKVDMKQPIFSSRTITTQIHIWDGQTVVMGGMIREEMVTIEDAIPIIGRIPLIGRLFRTEAEKSSKRNLLIFVTARLVDPAGKPIHRAQAASGAVEP